MHDNRTDRLASKAVETKTGTCGCYHCIRRVAIERATRIVRGNGRTAYLCDDCMSKKTQPIPPSKPARGKAGAR